MCAPTRKPASPGSGSGSSSSATARSRSSSASGLGSATAVPTVPSVHPLPLLPGPDECARARGHAAALARGSRRRTRRPAVLCFTGPGDRETAVRGVREVAREARAARPAAGRRAVPAGGNRELVDPEHARRRRRNSSRRSAATRVGIQFDVWHLWNTPDAARGDLAARAADRRRARERLARADARLGRSRPARRRSSRRPRASSAS